MRECERHPSESQPGGGVCAACLEERLVWLWRGESFRHDDPDIPHLATSATATTTSAPVVDSHELRLPAPEPPLAAPSSVKKQLQVLGVASAGVSSDNENHHPNGATTSSSSQNSKAVIEEWTEFHARRRRNFDLSDEFDNSPKAESSRSLDFMDTESNGERRRVHPNPELRILMNAQKMRSQSMPLDIRSAEETALRVINEQAADDDDDDDPYFQDLEIYGAPEERDGGGGTSALHEEELQGCFSPVWQSRKSPKWVKVLRASSPMTSRNRVFPSRSKETDTVRKKSRYGSRSKRGVRFDSSDWGFENAATGGGASPLWRGSSTRAEEQRKTRSVFSWLQDAETTQYKKYDQNEQLTSSSSSSLTNSVSTDSWLRDLTTVGHLHEIAEELEIVEESSEEEEELDNDLGDVSSFGKFLLLAAQRHPNAQLTRLASAPSY